MHLLQPNRLRRQPQLLSHTPPVLRDRPGRITDARPEVQRIVRRNANAPRPQRERSTYPRRCRPLGRNDLEIGNTHVVSPAVTAASSGAASGAAIASGAIRRGYSPAASADALVRRHQPAPSVARRGPAIGPAPRASCALPRHQSTPLARRRQPVPSAVPPHRPIDRRRASRRQPVSGRISSPLHIPRLQIPLHGLNQARHISRQRRLPLNFAARDGML
jgi:hypothetical protein